MRKHGLKARQFHARKRVLVEGVISVTSHALREWRVKEKRFKKECALLTSFVRRELDPSFTLTEDQKLLLYKTLR